MATDGRGSHHAAGGMTADGPVDARQRQAALDPARSCIVQAPAGSGKTGLLTQRFLRLLAIVDEPEEIVAITFTRKAAAEMRKRILQALEAARADADAPPAAQAYERQTWSLARAALARSGARGWQLTDNPQRLRVRTIDSLCQYLVRQMPLSAGFGEAPGVDERAQELYAAAARAAVAEVESGGALGDAMALLLSERDNRVDEVESLVAGMLAQREQWLRHLFRGDSRDVIEAVMRAVVERHLQRLRAAFPEDAAVALPPLARYAADHLDPGHALAACRDLDALPPAAANALAAWNALADLLLTNKGEWRKAVNVRNGFPPGAGAPAEAKQAMTELLERLRGEAGLADALHGLRRLPDPSYSDAEWALLQALLTVLQGAVAHLALLFAARGRVDFSEISLAAQRALGREDEPSDLALRLDHQVRHLLVDEFQDTSRSQHQLLRLLTAGWQAGDGRTLFLVGDPMQSIYRFRQAEVGLFLDAWQGCLGDVPLQPLQLSVNFRSRPDVVRWVNEVFPQVLPPAGDKELGAVPYAPCAAFEAPGRPDRDPPPAGVSVHPFAERDDAAETACVLELIEAARAEDPAGTTAVLVRSKAHLDALIVALRQAGQRYQAVEIGALEHRPQVMDLLSLTLALLHPADRVHWLALLRGPLCGLGLDDLHRLAAADPERRDRTVPALLADPARVGALSPDGQARCARLWGVLGEALAHRDRAPLRAWVEGAWLTLGGPLCLPDAAAAEDVEVYFGFLQELEAGGRGITPERLLDGVEALFSLPDPQADGRLQLMTIHKAKGLEFDTVILPGLGRRPRTDSPQLLYWLETTGPDGKAELFFGPVRSAVSHADARTSAYIRDLEKAMGQLESGRLLYVAATRARRRLHLLGHARPGRRDGVCAPDSASLLACLWPAVAAHWRPLDRDPADAVGEPGRGGYRVPLAVDPAAAEFSRVPADWRCPEPPAAAGRAREPVDVAEDAVVYEWAGDAARAVGTVVHRFLQRMAEAGVDRLDALPNFDAVAGRLLRGEGLPQAQLDGALRRVRAALERTLNDPQGRWILSAEHAGRGNEVPLTAVVDGRVRRLVVDRTFIDADGVRWIIDYKTGTHEGGDVAGFLDREQERYRPQLIAYATAYRALEQRPLRAALYYPLVEGGWRELEV